MHLFYSPLVPSVEWHEISGYDSVSQEDMKKSIALFGFLRMVEYVKV